MSYEMIYKPAKRDDDLAAYRREETAEETAEARIASLAHDIVYLRDRARRAQGGRVIVTIAIPWYDLGIELCWPFTLSAVILWRFRYENARIYWRTDLTASTGNSGP